MAEGAEGPEILGATGDCNTHYRDLLMCTVLLVGRWKTLELVINHHLYNFLMQSF